MMTTSAAVLSALRARLATAGLDLFKPFNTRWYDAAVAEHIRLPVACGAHDGSGFDWTDSQGQELKDKEGSKEEGQLAVLIGNTRAIWSPFISALAQSPHPIPANPINTYVTRAVREAVASCVPSSLHPVLRFSYDLTPGRVLSFQRLAHESGLAYLHPACHLCVHPEYGPWISLRVVVVLDAPPLQGQHDKEAPMNPCSSAEETAMTEAKAVALAASERHDAEAWKLWLAMRDACTVGAQHRYTEPQVAYHYTHDLGIIESEMQRLRDDGQTEQVAGTSQLL
ncbi:hypothetical protein PTSG_04387 [Salpingoeca rosetta]|uniref:Cyanocobalamin reductase (cyanide-eliminating) n=1 Tax=Salpingoeca rosetta (strain ATCC 50818 / BSB-021) TaxID=946362 RepID=F2U8E4_SALR5|nr:uncharacterized protein PTSG_04387 [Salpingoeca rosetta]EGD72652.1 hypothetical protein PTSG_04387 [Salpingoeca rosetta]|eukprot:XP_004994475.1 hypothetical protein PTSG_04387 [Salpingoeca rosetta]